MRPRSTKIVATLGPASTDPRTLLALVEAGANVFRLNFSHGTRDDHAARYAAIREIERALNRPIAILADLQGPKLRVGQLEGGQVDLQPGARFRLDLDKTPGNQQRAPLPHPEIFAAIEAGADLLLDDGRIRLKVEKKGSVHVDCTVIDGGILKERKGVNVPGVLLPIAAMTPKDRTDLATALELGVDWVALSFVQRPDDIAEAKKLVGGRAAVMAKIEKPAALQCIEEIIELADGLMVARGDLGVELPVEEVPGLQKRLVRAARRAGKPVVVATQMLESMITAPVPTRAEVSDVATAVYDGADAVMLSAETASGAYPIAAVAMMDSIAETVERDPLYRGIMDAEHARPEATTADAISAAAAQVANTVGAAAVVTYTTSGSTALRAARERPSVPILVLTPKRDTARRLSIGWGLHCVETEDAQNFADMVDRACRVAIEQGIGAAGDRLVITAGVPFGTPGATNVLRIAWIGKEHQ